MVAPKTYLCPSTPNVMLDWNARFERGVLRTDDPNIQAFVERHHEFAVGRITIADGPVSVPGAISTSTEQKPAPGLVNPPAPALQHVPIPPPSDALLKAHGLPVPAPPVSLVGTVADPSLPELPQPSVVARWSLARVLALATGRGIEITGNPTKDEVLDRLYPPEAVAVKAEV